MEIKTFDLGNGLWQIRAIDADLRKFDISVDTPFGTSYDSHLLKTGEGCILFDAVGDAFADEYVRTVRELAGSDPIRFIVVNHTEPDHTGALPYLLDGLKSSCGREPEVVGTLSAGTFLGQLLNRQLAFRAVKDGESMTIGGKTLEFRVLPHLHWPDTMWTLIRENSALITCDAFGSHFACGEMGVSRIGRRDEYLSASRIYFDGIMSPYASYLEKALAVARDMSPGMVLPGHGPVLDDGGKDMFNLYGEWLSALKPQGKNVVIAYASSYGFTRMIAESFRRGMEKSGKVSVSMFDLEKSSRQEVLDRIKSSVAIALGSPTFLSTALPSVYGLAACLNPIEHSRLKATAFGSYGWSSEAVPHLIDRFRQLKMTVMDSGFRVRFRPDESDLAAAEKFALDFVKSL